MSTDEHQDYIDYSDVVLLASIEVPRQITDPDDLHDLHLLASQDMVSFGSTMQQKESDSSKFFTIPTAKLTEYGKAVLAFRRSRMNRYEKKDLREAVKEKRLNAKEALIGI